jgi:RNA polymerase sigma factor (sigma-70 family)
LADIPPIRWRFNYGLGMEDREAVAAVAAGDLGGLADAYDAYAGSLYGYCHWMLGDPDDASDSVQDTFVIAASRLGSLGDPRKLRPWLYAVARNECQLRLDGAEPGSAEAEDLDDPQAGQYAGPPSAGPPHASPPHASPPHASTGTAADQAELREFVRAALDGLNPAEREAIELDLRHDLQGADLAAVLGVPRNQAHDLAARARDRLDKALGALLVARTGRRGCPDLDILLDGWDGELTPPDRKQIDRHVDQCDICADRVERMLRPAMEQGMAPLFGPPLELRDEVLQLCTSSSPGALSYRRDVTQRSGPFRPNGFPEPVKPPRRRVLALSGTTAAVGGVVVAIAATGIVAAIALTGGHPPASAATSGRSGPASQSSGAATSATQPGSSGSAAGVPIDAQPTISTAATASSSAPPPTPTSSPTRTRAHPSPSHPATPVASTPTSRPTFTYSPTPTPTVSSSAPGSGPTGAAPG